MKKYCVLGIVALALLGPAEGHKHHHRSGQISKREVMHQDENLPVQRCSKETQTVTLTIHVDEAGHTMGIDGTKRASSSTQVAAAHNQHQATPSSMPSLSASKMIAPQPSSSQGTTQVLQSGLRIPLPQATNLNQLSHSNPLNSNFVSDASNELLGRNKYGISYSPYNADNSCKTQDEVDKDIRQLQQFSYIRFYGVDCNQAQTITKAARENNMQVFAGIFDIGNIEGDLQKIIDAADGDWSAFHTVSVGNEIINRGQDSPANVVGAVNSARGILRQAGYQGPVVTVDTVNQFITHPELCDASDYCAVNCHAFFDATQTPENAGPYVLEQARRVSEATKEGSKRVIITESGWPSAGEPNGAAVPSTQNQMIAIKSLQQSFPDGGIIFFSAFNDIWKQDNAWTFGTEKHWGIMGLTQSGGDAIFTFVGS